MACFHIHPGKLTLKFAIGATTGRWIKLALTFLLKLKILPVAKSDMFEGALLSASVLVWVGF